MLLFASCVQHNMSCALLFGGTFGRFGEAQKINEAPYRAPRLVAIFGFGP